jgi:hypothetical protein
MSRTKDPVSVKSKEFNTLSQIKYIRASEEGNIMVVNNVESTIQNSPDLAGCK